MKLILLDGHGVSARINNAKLHLHGQEPDGENNDFVYRPKNMDVDHIVLAGQTGHVTLPALRWLVKHGVQVSLLDWNGQLLTTMLPKESANVKIRFQQYQTHNDEEKRVDLARRIIRAKFIRQQAVLNYLSQRYNEINTDFSSEEQRLEDANTILDILAIEGRVARHYWLQLTNVFPSKLEWEGRHTMEHPRAAGDKINVLLNYGYSVLEGEVLRAIHSVGLDPHVGFVHEKNPGKHSLAYDLMELFRFLVDMAVIELAESHEIDNTDFIRTENYTLRLRQSGAKKLVSKIEEWLNKTQKYRGRNCSWSFIILRKSQELANSLAGRTSSLDLTVPRCNLQRTDTTDVRHLILNISYTQWMKWGYSKGTLHYMKQNAKSNKPFTLNQHVKERLEELYKIEIN